MQTVSQGMGAGGNSRPARSMLRRAEGRFKSALAGGQTLPIQAFGLQQLLDGVESVNHVLVAQTTSPSRETAALVS